MPVELLVAWLAARRRAGQLLDLGADPLALNGVGMTALHVAAAQASTGVASVLASFSSPLRSERDRMQRTPEDIALLAPHPPERCQALLRARIMPSFRQHELAAIIQQQVVIHRDMVEERLRATGASAPDDKVLSSEEASDREQRRSNMRMREEEERALLLRFGSHL